MTRKSNSEYRIPRNLNLGVTRGENKGEISNFGFESTYGRVARGPPGELEPDREDRVRFASTPLRPSDSGDGSWRSDLKTRSNSDFTLNLKNEFRSTQIQTKSIAII